MADKGKQRKGKLRADKRGFSPSQYATITFQGRQVGESLRYTRRTGSCFCYAKPLGRYASPRFWLLLAPKVTPAQRGKKSAHAPKQRFFDSFHSLRMTEQQLVWFFNGRMWTSAPTRFSGCFGTSRTPSPTQLYKNVTVRKIQIFLTVLYHTNTENSIYQQLIFHTNKTIRTAYTARIFCV